MTFKNTALFFSSLVVTSVITIAGTSSAAHFRRWHASTCESSNPSVLLNSQGMHNTDASTLAEVQCSLPDDASYIYATAESLIAYVVDDSSTESISVGTCVTYDNAAGGICSAYSATPPGQNSPNVFILPLALTAWQGNASELQYVSVLLPKSNGGLSYIKGFRATWP